MAEELSLKPMTELLGLAFRVAFTICISVSGAGLPSRTSWAPKNQCRLRKASFPFRAHPPQKVLGEARKSCVECRSRCSTFGRGLVTAKVQAIEALVCPSAANKCKHPT